MFFDQVVRNRRCGLRGRAGYLARPKYSSIGGVGFATRRRVFLRDLAQISCFLREAEYSSRGEIAHHVPRTTARATTPEHFEQGRRAVRDHPIPNGDPFRDPPPKANLHIGYITNPDPETPMETTAADHQNHDDLAKRDGSGGAFSRPGDAAYVDGRQSHASEIPLSRK